MRENNYDVQLSETCRKKSDGGKEKGKRKRETCVCLLGSVKRVSKSHLHNVQHHLMSLCTEMEMARGAISKPKQTKASYCGT